MRQISIPRRLYRVVIVAIGLTLMTAACSGDTIPALDGSDDRSSALITVEGVDDAPADTDSQPTTEGDDRGAELIGRWEVVHYRLPDGALTNVVGDAPVFMEFRVDGTLSYGTGCNEGTVDYTTGGVYLVPDSPLDDTPEGQPITIGPSFQQTEIGCEGFLGDQDRDLPSNMGAAIRFRIDGERLLLLDEFQLIEATKVG